MNSSTWKSRSKYVPYLGKGIIYDQRAQFSESDAYNLFAEANLRPIQRWTDNTGRYSLWLLERPAFSFPLLDSPSVVSDQNTKYGLPSLDDWHNMWRVWDFITLRMIPPAMLLQKPIDLRHICLFYLGHIPTFLDIHLSRLLDEPHTDPQEFKVSPYLAGMTL